MRRVAVLGRLWDAERLGLVFHLRLDRLFEFVVFLLEFAQLFFFRIQVVSKGTDFLFFAGQFLPFPGDFFLLAGQFPIFVGHLRGQVVYYPLQIARFLLVFVDLNRFAAVRALVIGLSG